MYSIFAPPNTKSKNRHCFLLFAQLCFCKRIITEGTFLLTFNSSVLIEMKMASDHAVMETVLPNDNYCSLSRPTPLLSRHTTDLKLQNTHTQSFNYSRKANSSCSELVRQLPTEFVPTHCGAWWLIGRFVSFRPKACGFESCSSRHVGTLDKSFTRSFIWRFDVKLRYSIHASSGAPLSSSSGGLDEALQK